MFFDEILAFVAVEVSMVYIQFSDVLIFISGRWVDKLFKDCRHIVFGGLEPRIQELIY